MRRSHHTQSWARFFSKNFCIILIISIFVATDKKIVWAVGGLMYFKGLIPLWNTWAPLQPIQFWYPDWCLSSNWVYCLQNEVLALMQVHSKKSIGLVIYDSKNSLMWDTDFINTACHIYFVKVYIKKKSFHSLLASDLFSATLPSRSVNFDWFFFPNSVLFKTILHGL